jgi:hypothetical protein
LIKVTLSERFTWLSKHHASLLEPTALILSVSKIPYGENERWKELLEPFPCLTEFFFVGIITPGGSSA